MRGAWLVAYSKPIRDAYGNRVITGYESNENDKLPLPIQRDVVFGEELRGKEAAMRLTDAEREQMMIEMADAPRPNRYFADYRRSCWY
jgi:hypothetical protein